MTTMANLGKNFESKIHMHGKARAKRAQNVFAEPLDMSVDFVIPNFPKSNASVQFIDNSLADNFIFTSLTKEERRLLIDAMSDSYVPEGSTIISQGEMGDYFYVVEDGNISFTVNGTHVGMCTRGGSFGELALLYNCPRAATCIANTDCKLWKVDQRTFRYMLANKTVAETKSTLDVLRKVEFLKDLGEETLTKIANALTEVKFNEGDRIINKGDKGEVFYILKEGRVKVHDIGFGDSQYVDQILGPGDFFGERALLTGDPRVADVDAEVGTVALCLSREEFEKTLGPLQDLVNHSLTKRILMSVPLFANSQFEPYEMAALTDLVVDHVFDQGVVLAEEGKPAEGRLYVIRSGKVGNLGPGDYFGETLLEAEISPQTITVEEKSICGVLTKSAIENVIKNLDRLGKAMPTAATKDRRIDLNELDKVCILGVGTFGKVWLVKEKNAQSPTPYALKMLNKREILGHHQVDGTIREKNIMMSIDHPFVVKLVGATQDDRHLYMLLGIVQGGELFSVIHTETKDGIPNSNSRFYAACILESLAHLHERHVAYRDLKPENIMIDEKGYSVLIDLGFAKVVPDKTYTLCGTPEYLSPEIVLSKGHDKGADYWALGVLIYEMLVGRSPFYSYGADQVSMFKRIVQVKYAFPPGGVVNEMAQDLIQRLIVRRQSNRFGCLARGDADVRDHPWLGVISTETLLKKQIPAPWIPHIRDAFDTSNFESYKHIENELPSNEPALSAAQQDLFREF